MSKVLGVLLIIGSIVSTNIKAENASGLWTGFFAYPANSTQGHGMFSLVIKQSGNKLRGKIIEPDPQGNAVHFSANVNGIVQHKKVKFIKKYDGTAGRNHEVYYELEQRGDLMKGIWRIGDELDGTVLLKRIAVYEMEKIFNESIIEFDKNPDSPTEG